MEIGRPLFWYQGLFLQPQHFQLLDFNQQFFISCLLNYLSPYAWGIIDLEIQSSALNNFSLDIVKGKFLFPDGSFVFYPENAILKPRSFAEEWTEGGHPFNVYIGLKKWLKEKNVSVVSSFEDISDINTRFITLSEPEEVNDLYGEGPSAQVKRLYYVLRIFWESEIKEAGDYLLIPLAQLIRVGEEVRLSEKFIPPSLHIKASPVLFKIIKDIREQLSSRSRQLEEYKRERSTHTADFGSRDIVYMLTLCSLNRYVPLLYHFSESENVHPWLVYSILRQLIGELSSFSLKVKVLGEREDKEPLPAYNHRELWSCFSIAQQIITELLDEITAGPEYIIELVFDGTYYSAELKPAIFEGKNRYFLVLETEEDPKKVVESMLMVAKISSREYLPILIARALPGVKVEHLSIPPQELPHRAHCIYFSLDHHSEQWSYIEKGKNIALFWDDAPSDLKVQLMVVGR